MSSRWSELKIVVHFSGRYQFPYALTSGYNFPPLFAQPPTY